MVRLNSREYLQDPTNHIHAPSPPALTTAGDLSCPFGNVEPLDLDDLRMTAYEIFFTACRSSPGFGGRSPGTYSPVDGGENGPGSPGQGVGLAVTSRIKRALGLKMLKRTPTARRSSSCGSNPSSPGALSQGGSFSTLPGHCRPLRPLTFAEIMRQQMKVSEVSDNRLRKTLMRTVVGQTGRRADTIILPLELLRQLKPSEFNNSNEYHTWQKRQLKILEAGLLLHPAVPLDKANAFATCLCDIIHGSHVKAIDTGKNSDVMKTTCNSVVSLAWRAPDGSATDVCHWADGHPFNVHLYIALLRSIFDLEEETCVLDEVDELLELMKKTWSTLGITRPIHNLCFSWVLFKQYVMTGQVENDLLGASLTMLTEVANDAKKTDRDPLYLNMLTAVLTSMKTWSENRLLDYHESFNRETVGLMENILPLVFSATKILEEDVPNFKVAAIDKWGEASDSEGNKVDHYIRSSLNNAFTKMLENGKAINESMTIQEVSERLIQLAKETEEMAFREKGTFSMVLKKWHPVSAGVAAVTLHTCYGSLLRQFLAANSGLSNETIAVLQRADKLEKVLVNMVVEDSVECEDGGKTVVREMVPYEVDAIVSRYLRRWIQDSLKRAKDVVHGAKESETWNPKSKNEPYAQSAVELMKQTKEAVDSFLAIPIGVSEDLVREFTDGIEQILQEYTTFASACGSKQSYVPTLPPLTRSNRDSKIIKLWRKAAPACSVIGPSQAGSEECNHPRPSTSRGTQRLYIRINTLHYILSQLNSLDKNIALSPRVYPSPRNRFGGNRRQLGGSYFEQTRSAIQATTQHVSEVSAYRLTFLDSNSVFYGSLYVVENSRMGPALRILKQNLILLSAILTDRALPLAMKETMKASFEAYLMVLLAGGSSRNFTRGDFSIIEEDLKQLKRVFAASGGGFIVDDVVDREAETVEGVVALMGQTTEQLVEDFSRIVCKTSGVGVMSGGSGQKLPMPPTTGKWSNTDPNTILRVLCHRNEGAANLFLKKAFQLPKRK